MNINKFVILILLCISLAMLLNLKFRNIAIRNKGTKGEFLTFKTIEQLVKKNKGTVLKNVVLPLYEGTTEIDLLVVLPQGLIVIENKHYFGNIYGNRVETYWMQIINSRNKKPFYNPIKQNETHIKSLRYALQKNKINLPIFGYVVFSNNKSRLNFSYPEVIMVNKLYSEIERIVIENEPNINITHVLNTLSGYEHLKHKY